MDFASIRIITDDVDRLARFYELVTGIPARRPAPVFAEATNAMQHEGALLDAIEAQRGDDAQQLVHRTADRGRIAELGANDAVGVDEEGCAQR